MAERSWSDMPHELLSSILACFLTIEDVTSFYGVCRSWGSVSFPAWLDSAWEKTQIPLLVSTRQGSTLFHFRNPSIYNTIFNRSIPVELADAVIRFSKYGWLLMSHGKRAIFFFNPFTKAKIDLPDLPDNYYFNGIAFSSPPTSPNCVVFGTEDWYRKNTNYKFIRHGEKKWNRLEVDNNYDFIASHNNPVFHNGLFYCLGLQGNLGVFDPNKELKDCWTILTTPQAQPCNSIRRRFIAECNGEIISVFKCHVGKWVKVFKFEHSNMAWKELRSLGKNMLFLSNTTSFGLKIHETTKALEIEDKIYFPRFVKDKNTGVFYSLVTRNFQTFKGGYAREDFYNTSEVLNCTWIQPNYEVHTIEELQWCLPTDSDQEDFDEEDSDEEDFDEEDSDEED